MKELLKYPNLLSLKNLSKIISEDFGYNGSLVCTVTYTDPIQITDRLPKDTETAVMYAAVYNYWKFAVVGISDCLVWIDRFNAYWDLNYSYYRTMYIQESAAKGFNGESYTHTENRDTTNSDNTQTTGKSTVDSSIATQERNVQNSSETRNANDSTEGSITRSGTEKDNITRTEDRQKIDPESRETLLNGSTVLKAFAMSFYKIFKEVL